MGEVEDISDRVNLDNTPGWWTEAGTLRAACWFVEAGIEDRRFLGNSLAPASWSAAAQDNGDPCFQDNSSEAVPWTGLASTEDQDFLGSSSTSEEAAELVSW